MIYDCIECKKIECAVEKNGYCPDCLCDILNAKNFNYKDQVFNDYFLKRCNYVTTHYRDHYSRWSFNDFLGKLDEEAAELKNAKSDSKRKTELADIIMTCIACWGNMMKGDYADTDDIDHYMRKTLKKIEGRLADANNNGGNPRNDRF